MNKSQLKRVFAIVHTCSCRVVAVIDSSEQRRDLLLSAGSMYSRKGMDSFLPRALMLERLGFVDQLVIDCRSEFGTVHR